MEYVLTLGYRWVADFVVVNVYNIFELKRGILVNVIRLTLVGLLIFLIGCSETAVEEVGYGEVVGNSYTNKYFNNMSVSFPEDWYVAPRDIIEAHQDIGEELLVGDDKRLKAVMKASEMNSINLYSLFKYAPGSPVEFNSNISCVAERVSHFTPGVKKWQGLFFSRQDYIFASGNIDVVFEDDYGLIEVSGIQFDTLDGTLTLGSEVILQTYCAAKVKDYIIFFCLSYQDEESMEELLEIVTGHSFS